jgi:hypothetical protein
MHWVRGVGAGVATALLAMAGTPAGAQFFLKSKDLSGTRVVGDEPGIGQPMPGATADELEAGLVWNMRAALNVAALQCQFEPTMVTVSNYNAILMDHKDELKKSFDTITKYFARLHKAPKAAQSALDQFGTRTYAGFATVAAQYNFCEVANDIGKQAVFQPRGRFADVARDRMRELRNALTPWGDQAITYSVFPIATLPRVDAICWSKKAEWQAKKCGILAWPPVGVATAQR